MLTIFNTLIMLFKINQNPEHSQSDKVKLHFS